MHKKLAAVFHSIENSTLTPISVATAFLGIVIVRLFIENALDGFSHTGTIFFFYEFSHTLLFFALTYLLTTIFFAGYFHRPLRAVATVTLVGSVLIFLPPLIDFAIAHLFYGGASFLSYYIFDSFHGLLARFVTFFGDSPTDGITYGVRFEVALAVALLSLYGYAISQSIVKTAGFAFLSYTLFFLLGTVPSWITIGVSLFGHITGVVGEVAVTQLLLSPSRIFTQNIAELANVLNIKMSFFYAATLPLIVLVLGLSFFRSHTKKFLHAFQISAMSAVLLVLCGGVTIGTLLSPEEWFANFFTMLGFIVLVFAILAAVAAQQLLRATRSNEASFFGAIALLFGAIIHAKVFFLLLVFFVLMIFLHTQPFRLRRLPLLSHALRGAQYMLIFLLGILVVSPGFTIAPLPILLAGFFLGVFVLSIFLGDYAQDETPSRVPQQLCTRTVHIVIASFLFCAYVGSVFVLGETSLLLWAVLFGALSFWSYVST